MDLKQHLIDLSNTPGLSGYETPVCEKLQADWADLCDDHFVDALGNLTALKRGEGSEPRRKILVTAHMDEIGLMVTRIEDTFLRVINVGGVDRRVLPGQPVIVHGKKPLPGLIGSRPPHVLSTDDRKNYPGYDDLVVDTGLPADQLKKLVQIGTPVTFDQEAAGMGDQLVRGKAMDNRVSVALLTDLLYRLQTLRHEWDVLVVATVQEEMGLRGAQPMAWHTRPDLAVVVDTTWGIGTGVGEDKGFKLGGGPSLVIGPNAHPKLFNLVQETATRLEIPITPEAAPRSSSTDGWAIQVSREGIPTAILCIPIRNMHTPVEIVSLKDIGRTSRIILALIEGLDDQTLAALSLSAEE